MFDSIINNTINHLLINMLSLAFINELNPLRENERKNNRQQQNRDRFSPVHGGGNRQRTEQALVIDSYEDYDQRSGRSIYVAFLLGFDNFKLLKGQSAGPLEDGKGKIIDIRSKLIKITRIQYKDLPSSLKDSLGEHIETIVRKDEKKFVDFFNTAKPITTRLHSLKLLPGIGTKRMWSLLETRKVKKYDSFKDLAERGGITDPAGIVAKRILQEIQGGEKYSLFCK